VVEQLADGDLIPIGQDPRQPALHGVRQRQLALADQLQHHGGDKRLGHATDSIVQPWSHPAAGAQVGQAAGGLRDPVPVADPGGGAGRASRDDRIQQPAQLTRMDPMRARCDHAPRPSRTGHRAGSDGRDQ
jgi:hypothetical protein